jgi:hypothetical protein
MPFVIFLFLGIVILNEAGDNFKTTNKKTTKEVVVTTQTKVSSTTVVAKPTLTPKPEPVKEVIKAEIKQPDPIKEVIKAEIKQPDPIKEVIKAEIKQPDLVIETVKEKSKVELKDPIAEEVKVGESESNYLKIILYIIASIASIFGGFYYFSNRGNNQTSRSTVDIARKDIEESYQSAPQEENQTESQEQQPAQEEIQTDSQEQQPAQEETQTESQEQGAIDEDENNNK